MDVYEHQSWILSPPTIDSENAADGPKNRYLTFRPASNPGKNIGYRVTLTDLPDEYEQTDGLMFEGHRMWVTEPTEITEASGSDGPEPPPKFWGATLQCAPFYSVR